MAQSLLDALAAHPPVQPAIELADGQLLLVPLDLIDPNPFQPRVAIPEAELEQLEASIEAQGLLQAILVRPKSDGRYISVAGHRRVEAFRRLRAKAGSSQQASKWAAIPGMVKLALDDTRLAAMAFVENKERANLTLVEEGRALNRMVEAGLASNNEELAALTGQPVRSIYRLRRLVRAPKFILAAVESGVMVVGGQDEEGKERRELRRLELMAALAFFTLYEFLLQKGKPKVAEERVEGAVRRALAGNWSLRRIEEYVQLARGPKGPGAAQPEGAGEEAEEAPTEEAAVFSATARRFVIDLGRLKSATQAQREALKAALAQTLGEVA